MYLKRIKLENIRSHGSIDIEFDEASYAGWHVVIGDNGAGKSTLVRAIALALAGPMEIAALRQDWRDWLRRGCAAGLISLLIDSDPNVDKKTGRGRHVASLRFSVVDGGPRGASVAVAAEDHDNVKAKSYVWGTGRGWFSASYGPFRRFTGGNKEYEKLFYSNPKLAPHLTVFGEDVALTEALAWLHQIFADVRRVLDEMCSGPRRCGYCEDSCADEIEHIRPKDPVSRVRVLLGQLFVRLRTLQRAQGQSVRGVRRGWRHPNRGLTDRQRSGHPSTIGEAGVREPPR